MPSSFQRLADYPKDARHSKNALDVTLKDARHQKSALGVIPKDASHSKNALDVSLKDARHQKNALDVTPKDARHQKNALGVGTFINDRLFLAPTDLKEPVQPARVPVRKQLE